MSASLKQAAAAAAADYIQNNCPHHCVLGAGSGSTVDLFIQELGRRNLPTQKAVASSVRTQVQLEQIGMTVIDLNYINEPMPFYIDGADEINHELIMIKGGGGALTREKIVAAACNQFICIADETKLVEHLGVFPLPIEVIPMAQSLIQNNLKQYGIDSQVRQNFITDNGNVILDAKLTHYGDDSPSTWESRINQWPGVVTNGIFAANPADLLIMATSEGIKQLQR